LGRVYKGSVRSEPVSRGNSAVGAQAVRGRANVLARGGSKVLVRVKVLSFIPTASKVIAVNGKKSSNPA